MKIDVLNLRYARVRDECRDSLEFACRQLQLAGHKVQLDKRSNTLPHLGRNSLLAGIRPDADMAVFVDDDMLLGPDHLVRLISHGQPVISGICTTRSHPLRLAAKLWNEPTQEYLQLDDVRPNTLITGNYAVGAALLAVRREAIETLLEHYFTARDWLADNKRRFERLKVKACHIEEERKRIEGIRRVRYRDDQYLRIFDHQVIDDETQLGEDITFSRRLLQCGIKVSIDTSINPGHVGDYAYTLEDYVPESEQGTVLADSAMVRSEEEALKELEAMLT